MLGVLGHLVVGRIHDEDQFLADLHGFLETLAQPNAHLIGHLKPVHHQFDVVDLVAVHLHLGYQVLDLTIHLHFQIALLPHVLEQLAVVPLPAAHQRCQEHDLPIAEFLPDIFQDLLLTEFLHPLARLVGISLSGPGEEQAQEIIYFRDGTDRGSRVAVGGLLFDGDHRREPGDLVDIRTVHVADELAGIGTEGLHVAPLPLGEDRIKGEGGFSAAADAGDDDELVLGNGYVQVLEIVNPGTEHFDGILHAVGIERQNYELTGNPCDGSQRMTPFKKNILTIGRVHPNFTSVLWYAYPERLRVMAR